MSDSIKIVECPRDAMQGIHRFIPTESKIEYINGLLKVGFDTIDFGSFVSPKAIPQMRDTASVLESLKLESSKTKLLAIIVNERGANDALKHEEISYLGYPFSISETFQLRNTNSTIEESLVRLATIQNKVHKKNKELVVYLSMGFGNPYGDVWNTDICSYWTEKLSQLGIRILALSDTIGVATPESISYIFSELIPSYPHIEFGAHLHTKPDKWEEKVEAAYQAGCYRFDGAMLGYGGCPMAKDDLTGNMPTEKLLSFFEKENLINVDRKQFDQSIKQALKVFSPH